MVYPVLNITATCLMDLIDWNGAKEPVLSCQLSREEVINFRETPMIAPYFCLHTQGIECAVQELSFPLISLNKRYNKSYFKP